MVDEPHIRLVKACRKIVKQTDSGHPFGHDAFCSLRAAVNAYVKTESAKQPHAAGNTEAHEPEPSDSGAFSPEQLGDACNTAPAAPTTPVCSDSAQDTNKPARPTDEELVTRLMLNEEFKRAVYYQNTDVAALLVIELLKPYLKERE